MSAVIFIKKEEKETEYMAGQGLREQNKQRTFAHIKQTAQRLFAEKGYEQTTTREIAEAAGIATGTLFLYARDKAELLILVYKDAIDTLIDNAFATLSEDMPMLDALMSIFSPFFQFYAQQRENARYFLKEFLFIPYPEKQREDFLSLTTGFLLRLVQLVQQAQQRGEFRQDLDAEVAASSFYAIYFAAVTAWLNATMLSNEDVLVQLRTIFALQIRGMLP